MSLIAMSLQLLREFQANMFTAEASIAYMVAKLTSCVAHHDAATSESAASSAPIRTATLPTAPLSDCIKAVQKLVADTSRASQDCFTNPSPIVSGPYSGSVASVAAYSGNCSIQLVSPTAKPTGDQVTCAKTAEIAAATAALLASKEKGVLMTGGMAAVGNTPYSIAVTTCSALLTPCTSFEPAPEVLAT